MIFRSLPRIFLLACALAFASCTVFERGSPAAAKTVRADSMYQVFDAIESVFNANGYKTSGRDASSITMDKSADGTDRFLYGNWGDEAVVQRAKINVNARGEGKFRLRLQPSAVRNAGSVAFEDDARKFQFFSVHYGRMLNEVAKLLKEGQTEDQSTDLLAQ